MTRLPFTYLARNVARNVPLQPTLTHLPILNPVVTYYYTTTVHAISVQQTTHKDRMAQDPRGLLDKAEKAASGAGGGFSFFGGRQAILKFITCQS